MTSGYCTEPCSSSFIVLDLTFRSMIHFELITWYKVRVFHMDVQLFQHHLLKRFSYPIALTLALKTNWPYMFGSISGLFLFH